MVISADHIVKFIDDSPSFTPPQMAFFLFSSIDHQSTEAQAHVNLGCHTWKEKSLNKLQKYKQTYKNAYSSHFLSKTSMYVL